MAVALISAALPTTPLPAAGQELLRWRLEPGDTLQYRVTTAASSRAEGFGEVMEIGTEQSVTTRGVVREVNAGGDASVDWTFTRVEVVSSGPPPMGRQVWDSATDPFRVSVPTALRPQIELLAGRLEQTVTALQTARGEVRELGGVEAMTERLLQSVTDPVLARMLRQDASRIVSVEAVRQSFAGAAAYLPEGPVAPGSSWMTPRGEAPSSARPQSAIELRNTVRTIETRDGDRVAVIDHDGVVRVDAGGAAGDVRLNGTTVFSIGRGRVLSSTLTTESMREMPSAGGSGGAADTGGSPGMRSVSIATVATEFVPLH